ncbi:MAG: hypothetical protein OEU92_13145 [Alphaproteobacteria bacterium]|nr:hypothetical protein [Alphaproteobacteria bacterium]
MAKATPKDDVLAFFAQQKKTILTFLGYSGSGYERPGDMLAARQLGKTVEFIPADMNHEAARQKAKGQGRPEPHQFSGAVSALFSSQKQ